MLRKHGHIAAIPSAAVDKLDRRALRLWVVLYIQEHNRKPRATVLGEALLEPILIDLSSS